MPEPLDPIDRAQEQAYRLYRMTLECQGHGSVGSCQCQKRITLALLAERERMVTRVGEAEAKQDEYRETLRGVQQTLGPSVCSCPEDCGIKSEVAAVLEDIAVVLDEGEGALRYVTTRSKRFAHIQREDGGNTICGAMPIYYGGEGLLPITEEEAGELHMCKLCRKFSLKERV